MPKDHSSKLESEIQREILDYLLAKGYFVWRSNNAPIYDPKARRFRAQGKYAPKGLPDICGLAKGFFFGIEVKRPGNKTTAEQEAFLLRAKSLGHTAFCAYSVEDVRASGL